MRSALLTYFLLIGSLVAEITEQTNDFPLNMSAGEAVTKTRTMSRDGKKILMSMEFSDASGKVTQRNHMLYVAGEWVASLEDNGANGSLNGVGVFDSETRDMEYFYVGDGLDFVPASDEEMDAADKTGSDVEELLEDALEGGDITSAKVTWLKFKIWLRKWEFSMLSVAIGLAMAGFLIGRRTASKRSEQDEDTNPPPLRS